MEGNIFGREPSSQCSLSKMRDGGRLETGRYDTCDANRGSFYVELVTIYTQNNITVLGELAAVKGEI